MAEAKKILRPPSFFSQLTRENSLISTDNTKLDRKLLLKKEKEYEHLRTIHDSTLIPQLQNRVMVYPKIAFTASLEVPDLHNAYLSIRTIALNEINHLGVSEVKSTKSYDNFIANYTKIFQVINYIGVDEKQIVVIDIMDDDNLHVHGGYLFATVHVRVHDLQKPVLRLPIIRNEIEVLGFITLYCDLKVDPYVVSLNNTSALPIRFLRSNEPDEVSIRQSNRSFEAYLTFYNIQCKFANLNQLNIENLPPTTYFYIKICKFIKNDEDLAKLSASMAHISRAQSMLQVPTLISRYCSNDLTILYQSVHIDKPPYTLFCECKIAESSIIEPAKPQTNNKDSNKLKLRSFSKDSIEEPKKISNKDIKIVVQVYIGGYSEDEDEEECCSFVIIPFDKFLLYINKPDEKTDLGSPTEGLRRQSSENLNSKSKIHLRRKFKANPNLELNFETDKPNKEEEHKSISIFKRKNDTKPHQSLDALLNTVSTKFEYKEEDEDEEDEEEGISKSADAYDNEDDEDEDEGLSNPIKSKKGYKKIKKFITKRLKSKQKISYVQFEISEEKLQVLVSEGDDLYEEKIMKEINIKRENWMKQMKEPFARACDTQAYMLKRTLEVIEYGLEGWTIKPNFVIDMNPACIHHMRIKLQQQLHPKQANSLDDSFKGSNILNCLKSIYDSTSYLYDNNEFNIYAGGGVKPPVKDYFSSGYPREIAYPLTIEYLLENSKKYLKNIKSKKIKSIDDIHKKLDPDNVLSDFLNIDDEQKSWGGKSYLNDRKYTDASDLANGFLEASVLYQPCLVSPNSSYYEKDDLEEPLNRNTLHRSSSFHSTTASEKTHQTNLSYKIAKIHSTRYNSSYIDSGLNHLDNGKSFWDNIPKEFLHHGLFFNYDAEAIELLLQEPVLGERKTNLVVWMISKSPPLQSYHRLARILENQVLNSTKTALLIMMSSELRLDLNETLAETINIIADPFKKFRNFYENTLSRFIFLYQLHNKTIDKVRLNNVTDNVPTATKELLRHPNLRLCHWLTWSEIIAKAYQLEDENILLKQNNEYNEHDQYSAKIKSQILKEKLAHNTSDFNEKFSLPKVDTLRIILARYFTNDVIERIIGRFEESKKITVDKPIEVKKDKQKNKLKSVFKNIKKTIKTSITEIKPTITRMDSSSTIFQEDSESNKITSFSEFSSMKKRFDEEYNILMVREIREFMSDFLQDQMLKEKKRILDLQNSTVMCGLTLSTNTTNDSDSLISYKKDYTVAPKGELCNVNSCSIS